MIGRIIRSRRTETRPPARIERERVVSSLSAEAAQDSLGLDLQIVLLPRGAEDSWLQMSQVMQTAPRGRQLAVHMGCGRIIQRAGHRTGEGRLKVW